MTEWTVTIVNNGAGQLPNQQALVQPTGGGGAWTAISILPIAGMQSYMIFWGR